MPFIFCKLLKGGIFETLCLRWPGSKWRNWILVGRHWQCSVNCRKNTVSVSFIPGRSPGDFSGSFQSNTWHTVVIRKCDTSTLKTSKIFQEYLEQDASQGCKLVYCNVSNPSKLKVFLYCTFCKEYLLLLKCPWRPLSSIHIAIFHHSFSCTLGRRVLDPIPAILGARVGLEPGWVNSSSRDQHRIKTTILSQHHRQWEWNPQHSFSLLSLFHMSITISLISAISSSSSSIIPGKTLLLYFIHPFNWGSTLQLPFFILIFNLTCVNMERVNSSL